MPHEKGSKFTIPRGNFCGKIYTENGNLSERKLRLWSGKLNMFWQNRRRTGIEEYTTLVTFTSPTHTTAP